MKLIYSCKYCDNELEGNFGDRVYCDKCNKTFETDYDYASEENLFCWTVGDGIDGDWRGIDEGFTENMPSEW